MTSVISDSTYQLSAHMFSFKTVIQNMVNDKTYAIDSILLFIQNSIKKQIKIITMSRTRAQKKKKIVIYYFYGISSHFVQNEYFHFALVKKIQLSLSEKYKIIHFCHFQLGFKSNFLLMIYYCICSMIFLSQM